MCRLKRTEYIWVDVLPVMLRGNRRRRRIVKWSVIAGATLSLVLSLVLFIAVRASSSLIHLFRFRPQYSIHCVNLSGNYWAIDQCSDSIGFPRLVGWEEEQTFHSSILYQGSRTSEGSWFAINSILFLVLVRCPRISCTFINSAVAARPEPQTFD